MQLAPLLKNAANVWMTGHLIRRVSRDVVRAVPYPAIGVAALLGGALGALYVRRSRSYHYRNGSAR